MRPELDDTQALPGSDPPDPELDRTLTASPDRAAARASGELAPGLRLGHFCIEQKLGAGGMGEVYLANDLALARPVAIKVLPAGVGSGAARERLIREARAQARIHHPNVAHIYFIGEQDDRLYFAMEYVNGKTLADRVAEGPLPVEEALDVIHAAALGLREAQRSGFMHRDVKPSNLMRDGHGVVKVLDFGLVADAPQRAEAGPVAQTSLAGTPLYMAPEQGRGEPIDFRADIYALGATLYHLVSGRPPFHADSVDELIALHATAVRPTLPRGANPRTAIAAIDGLIARMMAARPEDRFASYDDLLRAIELVSQQHTRPAGIWVRSMATFVDLSLVALVIGLGNLIASGSGNAQIGRVGFALGIGYCTIALARWGTTAGKALFELEVVSLATSQRPSLGQAARRELVLGGAPAVMSWAAYAREALDLPVARDVFPLLTVVSIVTLGLLLLHASLRVVGKRAPWDRVSGTMVRYRTLRERRDVRGA